MSQSTNVASFVSFSYTTTIIYNTLLFKGMYLVYTWCANYIQILSFLLKHIMKIGTSFLANGFSQCCIFNFYFAPEPFCLNILHHWTTYHHNHLWRPELIIQLSLTVGRIFIGIMLFVGEALRKSKRVHWFKIFTGTYRGMLTYLYLFSLK